MKPTDPPPPREQASGHAPDAHGHEADELHNEGVAHEHSDVNLRAIVSLRRDHRRRLDDVRPPGVGDVRLLRAAGGRARPEAVSACGAGDPDAANDHRIDSVRGPAAAAAAPDERTGGTQPAPPGGGRAAAAVRLGESGRRRGARADQRREETDRRAGAGIQAWRCGPAARDATRRRAARRPADARFRPGAQGPGAPPAAPHPAPAAPQAPKEPPPHAPSGGPGGA